MSSGHLDDGEHMCGACTHPVPAQHCTVSSKIGSWAKLPREKHGVSTISGEARAKLLPAGKVLIAAFTWFRCFHHVNTLESERRHSVIFQDQHRDGDVRYSLG
jgi:hypothetical protein